MSPEASIALLVVAALLIAIGLWGIIFPAMPGAPLIFAGLVVAAWAEDFQYAGTGTIVTLAVLAMLTYIADIIAGAFGAKKFGASSRAMWGAAVGAIVGIFFGPLGIILGPFVGALVGELTVRRELYAAGMSGIGATLGLLLGAIAKFTLAFMMLALYAYMRFS